MGWRIFRSYQYKIITDIEVIFIKIDIYNTDKKYDVIYADPPWNYRQAGSDKGKRGMASAHYNTMNKDDIASLPIGSLTNDTALCFMWATFPNIQEALDVMKAWGFTYKTAAFVWVKRNKKSDTWFWGMGSYTRANAEVCLLGTKGKDINKLIKRHDIHQIIDARIERHSKKPDEVRNKIKLLTEESSAIELFAREIHEGWDCWGDEV